MSKSLEERLRTHSSAFNGLLSLVPAKYYFDDATQEQWKEKKKTKEELKLNKKLKLDPTVVDVQSSSAEDVLKKRELEAKPVVIPGAKFLKLKAQEQKSNVAEVTEDQEGSDNNDDDDDDDVPDFNPSELEDSDDDNIKLTLKSTTNEDFINVTGDLVFDDEGNEIEKSQEEKLKQEERKKQQKKVGKKQLTPEEVKEREERLAKLREKLSSKITALKEKRKAPGTKVNGAPSSREQILALRKLKLEQLKKRKLEEMEKSDNSDEDEDDEDDEISDDDEIDGKQSDSVLFQNIVFNDGDRITSDLTALRKKKGKKGPSNNDIKAHLAKLQLQKQKLSEMDSEKRSKHEEKSKWNRLLSNIEGVKLKDDEKLLKKALKRKEKIKMKSEREWRERKETVDSTIAARLKRRDENLQLRKENKGKKGKNQQKMKRKFTGIINKRTTPGAGADKKKRAGFEGRSKTGKKK